MLLCSSVLPGFSSELGFQPSVALLAVGVTFMLKPPCCLEASCQSLIYANSDSPGSQPLFSGVHEANLHGHQLGPRYSTAPGSLLQANQWPQGEARLQRDVQTESSCISFSQPPAPQVPSVPGLVPGCMEATENQTCPLLTMQGESRLETGPSNPANVWCWKEDGGGCVQPCQHDWGESQRRGTLSDGV